MKNLLKSPALILVVLLASFSVALSPRAAAVDIFPICKTGEASQTDVCKEVDSANQSSDNPIIHGLKVTIDVLTIIIGFTAVIMIIVAGLSFITANGDAQGIARARSAIVYALVGIVIVALSQLIVAFVLNKL